MQDKMIEIPATLFAEFIDAKATLQALRIYVKTERYPNTDILAHMLGIREVNNDDQ